MFDKASTQSPLDLGKCPEYLAYLGPADAVKVLGRLLTRALGFQIAAMYPAEKPWNVELRLVAEGASDLTPTRALERMVREGRPVLPLCTLPVAENFEYPLVGNVRLHFGKLVRGDSSFRALLLHPIWTLLNPAPISAAMLADFAAYAVEAGAPEFLLCNNDLTLSESVWYDELLRIALTPLLGRPLALLCALIELRYAELRGDLARYATAMSAIPDITSTRVRDPLYEALTGVPGDGFRDVESSWQFRSTKSKHQLMHVSDYVMAAFSRFVLSELAIKQWARYKELLAQRGMDVDGWPERAPHDRTPGFEFVRPSVDLRALARMRLGRTSSTADGSAT